jgi:UDPglucose 6-dehydrogenase
MIETSAEINDGMPEYIVDRTYRILNRFKKSINCSRILLLGVAYKKDIDDIRESPALRVIDLLLSEGAKVSAYDPQAIERTREIYGDRIQYGKDQYEILNQSDALILATEWSIFKNPEFDKMRQILKNPIIFDGRNQYDPYEMQNLGFEYYPIGRKHII